MAKTVGVETYPRVIGEVETVRKLHEGYSLARFGDGELKLMDGGSQVREPQNFYLGLELKRVLQDPYKRVLVGIPTMDRKGPKYESWQRHLARYCRLLSPAVTYYSSFISRPDSAPWIRTPKFAALVEKLWKGKRVALVCENDETKIHRIVRLSASELIHIPCPHTETYSVSSEIVSSVLLAKPQIAILSAGPAATCMAQRLAVCGVQAIDIGSAGGFLLAQLTGEEEDGKGDRT